jgi:hypothetical protein
VLIFIFLHHYPGIINTGGAPTPSSKMESETFSKHRQC